MLITKNALGLFSPFPNAAPKAETGIQHLRRVCWCLFLFGIFFCFPGSSLLAEALANLSGNLVSEWCVVCEVVA